MSKVEGGVGQIDPPPPRLRVTISSSRLLGLTRMKDQQHNLYKKRRTVK